LTTILAVYFLPKLAKTENNQETKSIFWSYFKHILPLFTLGLIVLFFIKDNLISILFTKEFLPVSTLFFWQLLGDFFKAISLILGYQFFAKKLTNAFIATELFSLSILYFSSVYLISIYDIQGIVMAHALTYFVYVLILCLYFRKSLF
jgi:PST family polysaccharide transporter